MSRGVVSNMNRATLVRTDKRYVMRIVSGLGVSAVAWLLSSSPASAEVAGTWRVSGEISGRAFVTDCRFEPRGSQFGGVCVDAATGDAKVKAGKAHTLTKGNVSGNQVGWTYQTSVMFMPIDIDFAGTQKGNTIDGTISAKGRTGHFTAVRKQ